MPNGIADQERPHQPCSQKAVVESLIGGQSFGRFEEFFGQWTFEGFFTGGFPCKNLHPQYVDVFKCNNTNEDVRNELHNFQLLSF